MPTHEIPLRLHLDDDGFLGRECPYCMRFFKRHIPPHQRATDPSSHEPYLLDTDSTSEAESDDGGAETEHTDPFCPYCGAQAPSQQWFSQAQVAYIQTITRNVAARLINEQLIRPLRRRTSTSKFFTFSGSDMTEEPEVSPPEQEGGREVQLPCCQTAIKVDDTWTSAVYCPDCGCQHELSPS